MRSQLSVAVSLLLLLFVLSTVNSQDIGFRETEDDISRRVTAVHPAVKVFNPSELQLIRRSAAVVISPLDLERRLSRAWSMGKREADRELERLGDDRLTADERVKRILQKNRENQLLLTPQQLQEHLTLVYQFGGLKSINEYLGRKATTIKFPKFRSSTPEEIDEMRKHRAEAVRMLARHFSLHTDADTDIYMGKHKTGTDEEGKMYRLMTNEAADSSELGLQPSIGKSKEEEMSAAAADEVNSLSPLNFDSFESEAVEAPVTASESLASLDGHDFTTQQFFFGTPYFGFGVRPFGYFGYSPGFWGRGWRGGWGRWGWGRRGWWGRRWGRRFFW